MPPQAEPNTLIEDAEEIPQKNVTFAINYEVSLVDEFVASERKRRVTNPVPSVEPGTESTAPKNIVAPEETELKRKESNIENNVPNVEPAPACLKASSTADGVEKTRRSGRFRQGKREVSMARNRVRYDMQLVPTIQKNPDFLKAFERWWMPEAVSRLSERRSTRQNLANGIPNSDQCQAVPTPFLDNHSVLWIPSKRSHWEDAVSEMTAVCTSAALHRYIANISECGSKPFQAPLSKDYIRDRVDIDDPINGYQIRHKWGGWLQGFCMWTNFTTWTHYFKWDSVHPQSGMAKYMETSSPFVDRDATLAEEMETLERSGDPLGGGIVFPQIAEIGLVGALGCGEYLMRMILDDIRSRKQYKYVVLQATDSSKTFYERYGFIRVGAICRYFSNNATEENPIVGYRHWTHANESNASLQMHGGPSYMMCLKLPPIENVQTREPCEQENLSPFLDSMKTLVVVEKPSVSPLGSTGTPATLRLVPRRSSAGAPATAVPKRKPGRKPKACEQSPMISPALPGKSVGKRKFEVPLPATEEVQVSESLDDSTEENPSPEILFSKTNKREERARSARQRNEDDNCSAESTVKPLEASKQPKRDAAAAKSESKTSRTLKTTKTADGLERTYYSVRGPDGRFVRIAVGSSLDIANGPKPKSATKSASVKVQPRTRATSTAESLQVARKRGPGRPPSKRAREQAPVRNIPPPPRKRMKESTKREGTRSSIVRRSNAVDRTQLRKQKVKAYPRARVHFYNRVVKPKSGKKEYYFVLHYSEESEEVRLVPMSAKGKLMGKREGRPRYQCNIGTTDENFITVPSKDYEVVPSTMVMKTPLVAQEAWDVEDD